MATKTTNKRMIELETSHIEYRLNMFEMLDSNSFNVGVDSNSVYFTLEKSVQEAIQNKSNIIKAVVRGPNEGVVWIHHMGSDMVTDLTHYPEYHLKFFSWAKEVFP